MANPDLRDWLAQMEAAGEVQKISGAERMEEIGGQFVVRSAPAEGATVCLRLPLPGNDSGNSSQARPIRLGDARNGESH